jgi:hypothetical protein
VATVYNWQVRENGEPGGQQGPEGRLMLANEFASVALEVDTQGNGPRLRIVNLGNRRSSYLDPLELASLTWLTHEDLGPFLDPSRTGWRNDGDRPSDDGGGE